MKNILVTGALGQIGSELVERLRELYGPSHVIATDIRDSEEMKEKGPFAIVDVQDAARLYEVANKYEADTIIHLAALLSAKAEKMPKLAWDLNMNGLLNALEVAKELGAQFFTPSSIGAFGPSTPKTAAPQETIQRPTTMYGINKVAGELLCDYYFRKYGVDTRGLRFPGLISYQTEPGGGTTDYAVDIYYGAVQEGMYTSYLKEDTYLDMMYMKDAIDAIIQLMEADGKKLQYRNAYNVTAFSACPKDFAQSIRKWLPDFQFSVKVDRTRQAIADSWPDHIDCSQAEQDWGFRPAYDLDAVTKDMLEKIRGKITAED